MNDLTPEIQAELRWLLDAPPQDITIARDDALALLDAAAERDALAAQVEAIVLPTVEEVDPADLRPGDRFRVVYEYVVDHHDDWQLVAHCRYERIGRNEDPRVEMLAEDLEASGQCCLDIWPCDRADEWRNDAAWGAES